MRHGPELAVTAGAYSAAQRSTPLTAARASHRLLYRVRSETVHSIFRGSGQSAGVERAIEPCPAAAPRIRPWRAEG